MNSPVRRTARWVQAGLMVALLAASSTVVPVHAGPDPVLSVAAASRAGGAAPVRCPADMVSIRGEFCIDRYEAFVAETLPGGKLKRRSPFEPLEDDKRYMALNRHGRMPQAYINQPQAAAACQVAGKRLCTSGEWVQACKGKRPTTWPYGERHRPGRCNDSGVSPMHLFYSEEFGGPPPTSAFTWERLNDSRFNRPIGTCAPSGRFSGCRNAFGVYDMVGNLHEWVADGDGTFRGGYYLDVLINGAGCEYSTTAHNTAYHDYSTGFRCCQ